MIGFIIRLAGWALLLGASARLAQTWWTQHGLDGIGAVQPLHDDGLLALLVAPVVLALAGVGPLRPVTVLIGFFLAAAALTAPLAIARVAFS